MIFVANDQASIKRSVWIHRRAKILRESVDAEDVQFVKVSDPDNVADGFTKPLPYDRWVKHASLMFPQFQPKAIRSFAVDPIEAAAKAQVAAEIGGSPY